MKNHLNPDWTRDWTDIEQKKKTEPVLDPAWICIVFMIEKPIEYISELPAALPASFAVWIPTI
ncbi:hypothetical protein AB3U99_01300 [Niallia sp. JL1B1071]|uniref:hypothetical protein n=1 Tax=Niallia tiangongensis TaxID=3237105 RepID=UPI0037DD4FCE